MLITLYNKLYMWQILTLILVVSIGFENSPVAMNYSKARFQNQSIPNIHQDICYGNDSKQHCSNQWLVDYQVVKKKRKSVFLPLYFMLFNSCMKHTLKSESLEYHIWIFGRFKYDFCECYVLREMLSAVWNVDSWLQWFLYTAVTNQTS